MLCNHTLNNTFTFELQLDFDSIPLEEQRACCSSEELDLQLPISPTLSSTSVAPAASMCNQHDASQNPAEAHISQGQTSACQQQLDDAQAQCKPSAHELEQSQSCSDSIESGSGECVCESLSGLTSERLSVPKSSTVRLRAVRLPMIMKICFFFRVNQYFISELGYIYFLFFYSYVHFSRLQNFSDTEDGSRSRASY